MALINISTKKDFEEKVIKSKKTVLVDFWASWCPPCRAMAPILEKVAKSLDDSVDVIKVNIEENAENHHLAVEYGVQSIPNMPIFVNGKEQNRLVGLIQERELINILNSSSTK